MALSPTRFAAILCFCACATTPGPVETAESYARALEEARWADAARLSNQSEAELRKAYADEALRKRRIAEVRESSTWKAAPGLTVQRTPEGWRVQDVPQEAESPDGTRATSATAALSAFLDAAEGGNFPLAWQLLSAPLRARYTPERLARDFAAEPLARERLVRARAALATPPALVGREAHFAIGFGRAVRLVEEDGGWRVEALE